VVVVVVVVVVLSVDSEGVDADDAADSFVLLDL
jgi:hypothetical protein